MRLRVLAFTLLCVGFSAIPVASPAAADQPDPTFSVSCTVGGETVVSWKHVRVTGATFSWYNSSGGPVATGNSTNPKGLRLSLVTPSGVDAGGTFEVTLFFAGGGGAELAPTTCTT